MTLQAASITLSTLEGAESRQALVILLKDLKNSVIGNTLRKVEVAEDEGLLAFLLDHFQTERIEEGDCPLVNEVAVIIGSLASEGTLTIRPLLLAHTPARLLDQVRCLTKSTLPQVPRILSTVMRSLRNVLLATIDLIWGHAYGVEMERKVVGTGLVGMVVVGGKGKAIGRESLLEAEAIEALDSIFEFGNLDTMLPLLESRPDQQSAFSLYQIYTRLVVLPSHREVLVRWKPPNMRSGTATSNISSTNVPYILEHLVKTISLAPNVKTLEAALDLLSELIRGQRDLVAKVGKIDISSSRLFRRDVFPAATDSPSRGDSSAPTDFIKLLQNLSEISQGPVRIAIAACMTNIIKVLYKPKQITTHSRPHLDIGVGVLMSITELWQEQDMENKIKLCYVVANLVADDVQFQEYALVPCDWPQYVMQLLHSIQEEDDTGELNADIAARGRGACLLALAALTANLERARTLVTDSDPPTLPLLIAALKHPSYGVRSAACQLARSLSRTVSLVRTSLMDSGVPEAVVQALGRECLRRENREQTHTKEETEGDRTWSVEITAMMAISNFVTDFSPFKETLLASDALTQIALLARSPYDRVAVEALWVFKNAMFQSTEPTKRRILDTLGIDWLKTFITDSGPVNVTIQALHIVQNYLGDATLAGLAAAVEVLDEHHLLTCVQTALNPPQPVEMKAAALGVLVNMCYGNEKMRQSIVARPMVVRGLVQSLDSPSDLIKQQALKALRNLVTSTTKSERPRMSILEAFRNYDIKTTVKALAENSPDLDVATLSIALYEVLDKAKPGHEIVREDPLDRLGRYS